MGLIFLEDLDSSPWLPGTHTSLWSLSSTVVLSYISKNGTATLIQSRSGVAVPPPFVQRQFANPVDLRQMDEVRFWFRSSRSGDGGSTKPFYLVFEITDSSSSLSWRRFLPVKQADTWQLHQLWLGDMPEDLRQAVEIVRLGSLDSGISFTAALGDLIATTPTPIQDVDSAFLNRLDRRFQVVVDDVLTDVPALVELPENPGSRNLPYILITPWSIQPQDNGAGSSGLIDNYTPAANGRSQGAFSRPAQQSIRLDYAIDAFAGQRSQKASLLEQIISSLNRQSFLVINSEPISLTRFVPSAQEIAAFVVPGRTPLFYQLLIRLETGDREFRPQASPFIQVGSGEGTTSEPLPV
jgi:hypothetical protein